MIDHTFVPRPGYDQVLPFRSERPALEVDLSDSTNQFGIAPSAFAALSTWTPRDVSEYPPVDPPHLMAAVASYAGVSPDMVTTGCGSDDLLDASLRALASPGDRVAHPSPTFAMTAIRSRANGLTPIGVPLLRDGDVDATAMLETGARVMYLCSPNNPTGTSHSRAAIERVIEGAPGVVILDEAYAEFADEVHTAWAAQFPHVVVLRTLSKSFGLAGLRVGFAAGSPVILTEIAKARGPYRVNAFASRAATAALENDRQWMANLANDVRALRARFAAELRAIGLAPLVSHANFLCVPVPNARAAVDRIGAAGIVVRGFSGLPGIGDALRIGLAPWPVLERVRDALRPG